MYQDIGDYVLRDWEIEDAPSIAKYANNRKIWRNLRDGFPYPYSVRNAEAFISNALKSSPPTLFAIATDTEAIGSIGLTLGCDVHRFTAEMGYFIGEPFWGKGIMTRAVRYIAEWATGELGLHRVSAEPYAPNAASHRVLEKAGFIREGLLRASAFKDGKVVDQVVYSYVAAKSRRSEDEKLGS